MSSRHKKVSGHESRVVRNIVKNTGYIRILGEGIKITEQEFFLIHLVPCPDVVRPPVAAVVVVQLGADARPEVVGGAAVAQGRTGGQGQHGQRGEEECVHR